MSQKIETRVTIFIKPPGFIFKPILKNKNKIKAYLEDSEIFKPHITIYKCRFNEKKYPILIKKINNLNLKSFSLKLSDLKFSQNDKDKEKIFIYFNCINKEIKNYHKKIFNITNSLRGKLIRQKDIKRFEKGIYSKKEFNFIKENGYKYVGKYFNPHITIGSINKNNKGIIKGLKKDLKKIESKEFIIDHILIKYSQRTLPEEKRFFESKETKIILK